MTFLLRCFSAEILRGFFRHRECFKKTCSYRWFECLEHFQGPSSRRTENSFRLFRSLLLLTLCDFPFEFGDLPLGIFAYNRSFYSSVPHFKLKEKSLKNCWKKRLVGVKVGHFPTSLLHTTIRRRKRKRGVKRRKWGPFRPGRKKEKRKEDSLFFSSLFRTKEKLFCLFFLFPSSLLPIFSAIVCS